MNEPLFTALIRSLYREWVDDGWYLGYASTLVEGTGHTPTDAEKALAFVSWAEVIRNVAMTFDEYDAAIWQGTP